MIKIGLFPLGIVLLPESSIPLHIFEERYKTLINDCNEKGSVFGINLVNSIDMNEVGCTAKIEKILKRYPDGKIDLIITGIQRYKIINFSEGDKPYYIGEVEYYDDEVNEYEYVLFQEAAEHFNKIVTGISTIKIDPIYPEKVTSQKPSFIIAQKSGLSIDQRQQLLEMKSEDERLEYLIEHLKTMMPVIKESEIINKIIKNDGYFPPRNFNK